MQVWISVALRPVEYASLDIGSTLDQ